MILEIEGIPIKPEYFSKLAQDVIFGKDTWRTIKPEDISNIKLKEITKNEIIIQFECNSDPNQRRVFELTTLKLDSMEPIEREIAKHTRQFNIKIRYG